MAASSRTPATFDLLVCPVCHGRLHAEGESAVCCTGCSRRYPVIDGIPVLLEARAN